MRHPFDYLSLLPPSKPYVYDIAWRSLIATTSRGCSHSRLSIALSRSAQAPDCSRMKQSKECALCFRSLLLTLHAVAYSKHQMVGSWITFAQRAHPSQPPSPQLQPPCSADTFVLSLPWLCSSSTGHNCNSGCARNSNHRCVHLQSQLQLWLDV